MRHVRNYIAPMFIFCAASVGCGAVDSAEFEGDLGEFDESVEEVDQLSEAWSVSSCGDEDTVADKTFTGKISPAHVSPRTYNNCYKSYVVDVKNMLASHSGLGGGGGPNSMIQVQWADTVPTTQAACEAISGGAIFYKRQSGAWVALTNQVKRNGLWASEPISGVKRCYPPAVSYNPLVEGTTYRVAATMRAADGLTTRKVSIETQPRIVIR